jgi:hypothetical protein
MTKKQRDKSHTWWRSLSINEMNALAKKYYPDVSGPFVSQTPSLVYNIYQNEVNN